MISSQDRNDGENGERTKKKDAAAEFNCNILVYQQKKIVEKKTKSPNDSHEQIRNAKLIVIIVVDDDDAKFNRANQFWCQSIKLEPKRTRVGKKMRFFKRQRMRPSEAKIYLDKNINFG